MLHPSCLLAQMFKQKQILYLFFINTSFINGGTTLGNSEQSDEFILFLKEKLNQV